MKKVFSVLLAVLLLAGLSVTALAANAVDSKELVTPPAEGLTCDTPAVKAAVETLMAAKASDLADPENETYGEIAAELEGTGFQSVQVGCVFEAEEENPTEKTIKVGKNFLGLFALKDGKWVKVDVEVVDGEFKFTPEKGVIYALFYGSDASPATGESVPYALLIAALVLAGGAVVFFRKSRKANA